MRFDMVMEAQKAGAIVHPKFVSAQHSRILLSKPVISSEHLN
jgi:hypothetical protein